MKVVVTGAGGMLAQALLPLLERGGHEVMALRHADADVADFENLVRPVRRFRPEWVFNLAAFTRVDDCEEHPDRAFAVNALGARNAALAAIECEAAILTLSTDYVFDGTASTPYREYHMAHPRSVYGASKWAGEQAVREVHPRHLVVRTSWLYGKGGANFVETILRKAQAGEPLQVVDDQRGSPTWTEDLAGALLRLATAGQYGTYHVTNSGDCTWYELAAHVIERAGFRARLERVTSEEVARPATRPAYSVLHNQFYEQTARVRMPDWKDAVERYVKTYVPGGTKATAARD